MTIERNDPHCPKNLVPGDYEYVAPWLIKIENFGDVVWQKMNREVIDKHMERTGGNHSCHHHGGICGVCGSVNAIYTVLFWHRPTNTYIKMGRECADLVDRRAAMELDTLRDKVRNWREAQKGKNKARVLLADAGLDRAWEIFNADGFPEGEDRREELTIQDIVGKLVRYGSISNAQTEYLRKLLHRIDNRAAIEAKRKAEQEAAAPCPTGRVEIRGTVMTVRVDDGGMYGPVTKWLVKADEGFKVWGTMPAEANANRGDKVIYKATVEPSKDDPKFGFGSRPKLVSIEPAEQPAEQSAAV